MLAEARHQDQGSLSPLESIWASEAAHQPDPSHTRAPEKSPEWGSVQLDFRGSWGVLCRLLGAWQPPQLGNCLQSRHRHQ